MNNDILDENLVGDNTEQPKKRKKKIWTLVGQTLINILTALLTALGATSCANNFL